MKQNMLVTAGRLLKSLVWIGSILMAVASILTVITLIDPELLGSPEIMFPVGFAVEGSDGWLKAGGRLIQFTVPRAVGYVAMSTEPRGAVALVWLFVCAGFSVMIIASLYLRRIIDSAARGEPFEQGNAGRIKVIGWAIAGFGVLRTLYFVATYFYTVDRIVSTSIRAELRLDLSIGYFAVGILMLALGDIFSKGEELQADHDLTV